jgi:hypothetical protein
LAFEFAPLLHFAILDYMKTKLIIECSGGVVTAVYGNKDIEVTLIDWDDINEGDKPVQLAIAPLHALSDEAREVIATW